MAELIKIEINENGERLVSARELHESLNVAGRFSRWFETYVLNYGFVENQDFTSVQICTVVNNGAERELQDYALTIDVAKHVCMLQRSDLGMKFRQYFIECEKQLKEIAIKQDSYLIENPIERAKRWIEEQEERERLANKIEEQKPLVQLAETRIDKKGCFSLTDVTKSLGLKRGNISRWAKEMRYIHKTQTEVNRLGEGYFKVYSSDGKHNQIGITEKGLQLIKDNLRQVSNS